MNESTSALSTSGLWVRRGHWLVDRHDEFGSVGRTRWRRHALSCLAAAVSFAAGCQRVPEPAAEEEAAPVAAAERVATAPRAPIRPQAVRSRAGDWFRDETRRSGIDFKYQSGRDAQRYTILETVGGGVGMIDYDLDDDLDLFFPGGGRISAERISGLPGRFYLAASSQIAS